MIKKFTLLFAVLSFASCAELQKALEGSGVSQLSNTEIIMGLKEALDIGVGNGSEILSAKDGFYKSAYKILLPEEARVVTERLKFIPGFTQIEEIMLEKINRGAEDAAKKAYPIFKQAIRQMTISDGLDILLGPDDAATSYLNRTTYSSLYTEFNPVIVNSLNQFNAIEYWENAVSYYNQIPFITKANPKLDDYVTTQALNALFDMVEKEEFNIRRDIKNRTTELLKRVFAHQDANRT